MIAAVHRTEEAASHRAHVRRQPGESSASLASFQLIICSLLLMYSKAKIHKQSGLSATLKRLNH